MNDPAIPKKDPKKKLRASTVLLSGAAWDQAREMSVSTGGEYSRNEIIELAVRRLYESWLEERQRGTNNNKR